MTRTNLIKKYRSLFWYLDKSKLDNMSDEVLVEFILNYGSWKAFCDLIKTLGLPKVAGIFKTQKAKKRTNLLPEIIYFFNLFFKKNAPEYSR